MDDLAARGVDEYDVLLHLGDGVLVDQVVRGGQQRDVDGDEVGVLQQVVELHVLRVGNGLDPVRRRVSVITKHLRAESVHLLGKLLSNHASTYDSNLKKNVT